MRSSKASPLISPLIGRIGLPQKPRPAPRLNGRSARTNISPGPHGGDGGYDRVDFAAQLLLDQAKALHPYWSDVDVGDCLFARRGKWHRPSFLCRCQGISAHIGVDRTSRPAARSSPRSKPSWPNTRVTRTSRTARPGSHPGGPVLVVLAGFEVDTVAWIVRHLIRIADRTAQTRRFSSRRALWSSLS
jgi:hypothetical protein